MTEEVLVVKTPMTLTNVVRLGRVISGAWPEAVMRNSADGGYEIVLKGPYTGPEEEE
jgi:hypothetical protein